MLGLIHQHGGNAHLDFSRLGITPRDFIDFSVNVHPLGVPNVVIEEWQNALQTVTHYPSQAGEGVKQFYQNRFNIPGHSVLVGNGSIELIYLIPRALGVQSAIIFEPTFFDYANACQVAGLSVKSFSLTEEEGFNYPTNLDFLQHLAPSLIFLGRPNNPTGTLVSAQTILDWVNQWPQHYFIIDEAFIQFTDYFADTLINPTYLRNNILVLHSLTKFYSLAGLRVGALISTDRTIAKLAAQQVPWAVNGICDYLMPLIGKDRDYENQVRQNTQLTKKAMLEALNNLTVIKVYGSAGNFIFFKWLGSESIDDLLAGLLKQGIYVRSCANYHGLADGFFRVAVRDTVDNLQLIIALKNLQNPFLC